MNNDPDIWAPANHEFTKTTRELERFGGRNFAIIGVFPKQDGIYQPHVLEKYAHRARARYQQFAKAQFLPPLIQMRMAINMASSP